MAFGFQLPTYGQKKKEEEDKQPMQSKVPMQSKIPSKEIKTPTIQTQSSNRAGGIPTKPMMSYNIEGTIMPGVADDKATMILDYAKKNTKTPAEQKLLIKDMHTEAIRMEQKKAFEKDRTEMKAQVMKDILKEPDPVKQKKIGISIKLAEFADTVRDWSISQGIDPNDNDDQSVSTKFIEANPDFTDTFTDFVNGKITNVDLGKKLGIIPKEDEVAPVEEGTTIQNIGEGLASYAGGIPKVVAETGILDKLAETTKEAINEGKGGLLGDLLLKIANSPEGMAYKQQNPSGAFSEFAGGSQVGGNPDSKVAKKVETVETAAEVLSAVPALIKGGTKLLAKNAAKKATKGKTVLKEIIAEPETTKIVQKALKEGRLEEGARGWIKRMLIGEKGATIKTTKQIDEAADLIVNNIKNPSTKPTQLYKQIMGYVSDQAKTLSNKLKKIDITKGWSKADIKLNLKELAENTDEFTKADIKKIKDFSTRINKATNLDELWTVRKEFDDIFSNAVKNATDISAPGTRRANKLWTSTRNILNDSIDEIANNISDSGTKKIFKELSAMYKAADNIVAKAGTKMLRPTKGLISKGNIVKGAVATGLGYLGLKKVF